MSQDRAATSASELTLLEQIANATDRRRFLQWAGVTVGVVLVAGCGDDDGPTGGAAGVNLGSGDVGVLNYAYALEQLEAAFYTRVVANQYTGITTAERTILTDIRDHEIVHREFLKAALGSGAIGTLEFDFASVNFTSRASVLGTAKVFEDLTALITKQLSKKGPGVFNLLSLVKLKIVQKPATPAKQGINPFTKEPMTIKAKPARRDVRARALKGLRELA